MAKAAKHALAQNIVNHLQNVLPNAMQHAIRLLAFGSNRLTREHSL
jgi:hypothetical protein